MSAQYRVLLVEDSVNDAFLVVRELQRGGLDVNFERVETIAGFHAALEAKTWDLIICDHCLPGLDGTVVLSLYQRTGLDIPFIMVSGRMGEDHAVEMIKAGAHEYVLKDNLDRLVPAVNRELRAAQERAIRRQTEAPQAYLASVVESCNDAIIGKTLDGTILSWNAGAERLYGYGASEMIGRSVSLLIPAYRPDELHEMMEKLSRGERVEAFETVRIRKDGSAVEVSLTISPIKDPSGRTIGASSVAGDITLRKQQENERLGLIQELTAALAGKNDQAEKMKPEWESSPLPHLDILLVDDDHHDPALFGIAVDKTDLNISLQTVTDGDQAIDYLEGRDVYADRSLHPVPDLVVLDLDMRLTRGLDFLDWRRASQSFASLPVVIFSDLAYKGAIAEALAMGASRVFPKPFEFEGWKAVVQQICDFGMECRRTTGQKAGEKLAIGGTVRAES